jgi:hypothetical protein
MGTANYSKMLATNKWSYLIRLESLLHIYSEETTTQMWPSILLLLIDVGCVDNSLWTQNICDLFIPLFKLQKVSHGNVTQKF